MSRQTSNNPSLGHTMMPLENYGSLMQTIRERFDVIGQLKASHAADFARAESAAFHGRKIVEGTAFTCLVSIENGLTTIPRDAKGSGMLKTSLRTSRRRAWRYCQARALSVQPRQMKRKSTG